MLSIAAILVAGAVILPAQIAAAEGLFDFLFGGLSGRNSRSGRRPRWAMSLTPIRSRRPSPAPSRLAGPDLPSASAAATAAISR